MRRRGIILAALSIAGAAWVFVTIPRPAVILDRGRVTSSETVVRGAYHVHSVVSDGTGTPEEIAAAAARAGLDFVILTDHGNAARAPRTPRFHSGVLCIDAVEISTDEGHYVALDLPQSPYPLGGEARDVVDDVMRLGGFGIAAHPDSAKHDLSWREWNTPLDGIEWFNADSQWRDEPRWRLLPALLHYAARPSGTVASVFDRPADVLATWDRLALRRPIVGLAAHDAHQRLGLHGGVDPYEERWFLRLPSYEAMFRAFAIRVAITGPFGGRAPEDAGRLLASIKAGRVFTGIDAIATPVEFSVETRVGNRGVRMGESVPLDGPITVAVRSNAPAASTTVLLRNGRSILERPGNTLQWAGTMPGTYRAEVRVPDAPGHPAMPWIVGNPVYIGQPALPPPAAVPPAVAMMMWPALAWVVEKDAASQATLTTTGGDEAPAIEIAYGLAQGTGQSPYVAAATRDVVPLRDATRLGFRVVADRPMRASVQVRLQSPDPDQRWRRSFYADTTPRDLLFLFDDLRPVRSENPSRLDPKRIDALLVVIDGPHTPPGSVGRLRIDRIRTER